MLTSEEQGGKNPEGERWFMTTQWSMIVTAQGTSPAARAALEKLCRTYWYPLYAYVRRKGYEPAEAEDLTQSFFLRFFEKDYLWQVHQRKGRFRSFLLAALSHFLSDERDRAQALKRGGGATFISLDSQSAEEKYRLEPIDPMTPEKLFDRRWAMIVLEQARQRLRQEYSLAGKAALFEKLEKTEEGYRERMTYAELASQMGTTESGIKSAVQRLRHRYRELVRFEIAQTVTSSSEIDEEIRHLISVLSS